MMSNQRYERGFGLAIACLLLAASFVMAQESEKNPIKIGGAIGVTHAYGSYDKDPRGEGIGGIDLDIFRLNVDLDYQNVIGRIEYRWYAEDNVGNDDEKYSYSTDSMIHTAWLGYNLGDSGTLKAGIVRVPFGPTAYGVSSSWFFDQHFYVGLADDMDLGIRWSGSYDKLTLDVGYYLGSEPQTEGESLESSRYGYDVVRWEEKADADGKVKWAVGENGFEEQHQFNLRAIYAIEGGTEVGASLQYGLLQGTNIGGDDKGDHYALSGHMKNDLGDFTLYSQLTYYVYNITDETPWGTGDLIPMGAYDFAWPIASEGVIPALSLRYNGVDVSGVSWLDSMTPYVEWSSILKPVERLNDSTLITVGAAWTLYGALYVYSDVAFSDGNNFVGNEGDAYSNFYDGVGDVGANGNNSWNWRLNFNFRYYF
jgi:hypothetical protein